MLRKAVMKDLVSSYEVIKDAKKTFKERGSTQWQDLDGYPSIKTLEEDIKRGELYVYEENSIIAGIIVISKKEEECYKNIYEGAWLSNGPYLVLHRLAILSSFRGRGIASKIMAFATNEAINSGYHSLKADTMENNKQMIETFLHNGFKYCGKINLLREDVIDKMRYAYEKVF